eukprot:sb/3473876/
MILEATLYFKVWVSQQLYILRERGGNNWGFKTEINSPRHHREKYIACIIVLFYSSVKLSCCQAVIGFEGLGGGKPRIERVPNLGGHVLPQTLSSLTHQEPTESSKQPIRTRYLGHVTGYQPIRNHYFLIRSVPVYNTPRYFQVKQ